MLAVQFLSNINTQLTSSIPVAASGGSAFYASPNYQSGSDLYLTNGSVGGAQLLRSFNPSSSNAAGGKLGSLTVAGTNLFFTYNDGVSGAELWVSNGTSAGTGLLKDINPGAPGSSPTIVGTAGPRVFFLADNGVHGRELWASDGSNGGTQLLADINPGAGNLSLASSASFGGLFYFVADQGQAGQSLYVSNGTPAGTLPLRKFTPAAPNYVGIDLTQAVSINGQVLFAAKDAATGVELWKTDGTVANTAIVKDINPGTGDSSPSGFKVINNVLYFSADNGQIGSELWRSDGTLANTRLVHDVIAGPSGSELSGFDTIGPWIYFRSVNGFQGVNVWRTDGTDQNTTMVGSFAPASIGGPVRGAAAGSILFTTVDNFRRLQLIATDVNTGLSTMILDRTSTSNVLNSDPRIVTAGSHAFISFTVDGTRELYASDGTAAGTINLSRNAGSSISGDSAVVWQQGNSVFYVSGNAASGRELWSSDGTQAGTVLLKDISPGAASSNPSGFTVVQGRLYFTAQSQSSVSELWITDGSPANGNNASGPVKLQSAPRPSDLGSLQDLVTATKSGRQLSATLGGKTYFTATDADHGTELWVSDGTPQGTRLLADLVSGPDSSNPAQLTVAGNYIYFFTATPGTMGLWRTDGTAQGTIKLLDSPLQGNSGVLELPTTLGGKLYFRVNGAGSSASLWTSDGTQAGTALVQNFSSGFYSSTAFGTSLVIEAASATGNLLWITDGTPGGTRQFLPASLNLPSQNTPIQVGNSLFLVGIDATGTAIWRSDADGIAVKVAALPNNVFPSRLTAVGSTLYLVLNSQTPSEALWKTDGTPGNLVKVKDFPAAPGSGAAIQEITELNGRLLLVASSAQTGRELWVSDGTGAGTVPLKDINPGPADAFRPLSSSRTASAFKKMGGMAYFSASNGTTGVQVWKTDGTPGGTTRVDDTVVAGNGNDPLPFGLGSNGAVIVAADDGIHGYEPMLFNSSNTQPGNQPPTLASIPGQQVIVGQLVSFQAAGSDPDGNLPLTYSLDNPPAGATINPNTGAFSWVPGTPGTYAIDVRVTDSGGLPASATTRVSVIVQPALVTVSGVDLVKTKTQVTGLRVRFSGPISPGSIRLGSTVSLVLPGTGRKPKDQQIALKIVSYDQVNHILLLGPKAGRAFNLARALRLTINGVTDSVGRGVDGNRDGQPGGLYRATVSKTGVKPF